MNLKRMTAILTVCAFAALSAFAAGCGPKTDEASPAPEGGVAAPAPPGEAAPGAPAGGAAAPPPPGPPGP
jgi:hypothetical protein